MAGQPRVITEKELDTIETLACALSIEQVCSYLGIGKTSFYRAMKRQPEIEERYKKGKAVVIKGIANSLITTAMKGNLTAQMFYLKTNAGWREKSDMNVVQTNVSFTKEQLDKLTTEELTTMKQIYEKLNGDT